MPLDHPINIGDYQLRPAWKAVHIGLPMQVTAYILGTIVTRMCAVMHVSKLQPGRLYLGLSLHSRIIASKAILQELNVEVKPSRLLSACIPFRGLRYACPRLPTSASRCVLPSRQVLAAPQIYRVSYAFSVNLYLTEIYAQKKDAYQLCILLFEPLVGFEPTTPRLQITCSGQLS